jgi:hypothetical protein
MVSSYDFALRGDSAAARRVVEATLARSGFELFPTPGGGYIAAEVTGRTGFFAGLLRSNRTASSFVVLVEERDDDDRGEATLRVRWNNGDPKGPIISRFSGDNPGEPIYLDAADALTDAFDAAGILIGTTIVD